MRTPAQRFRFRAMGSPCELHLYGDPAGPPAEAVAEAARAEVERIEAKYSRYRDTSLLSRINASAGDPDGIAVDDETASLLDYAETAFEESDGLFDITSGVLRQVWDFRSGKLPARDDVERVLARVGWRKLRWERPQLFVPAGMQLDFGGFGKEYAADRTAELCRRLGARSGLIDLGGDVSVIGPHPDGNPWRVGVQDPRRPGAVALVPLARGGIATSGDYQRFLTVDGRRYAHILDPRTGWPVKEGLASVSVIASHCLIAGTASTIAMLKGTVGADWLDALGLRNLRVDGTGRVSGTLATQRPVKGRNAAVRPHGRPRGPALPNVRPYVRSNSCHPSHRVGRTKTAAGDRPNPITDGSERAVDSVWPLDLDL